jgi:hypothetical protein
MKPTRRKFLTTAFSTVAMLPAARELLAAAPTEITGLTLTEAERLVRKKSMSPVELTKACLARINQLNPKLNAFITVNTDSALSDARAAEAEIRRGKYRGPIHGIPIGLKDNIDTAGIKTTAASAAFAHRVPIEDAEVVRRLKAAGAVILGKLNMGEFAHGTVCSHFGPVHNPWGLAHIAGGSSNGKCSGIGHRSLLWRGRHGHGRVDPNASRFLRDSWFETDVWLGERSGGHS